jgi:antitoxin (DNA-binding transcriptional repressor) of toxin-antitoxin stability system
MRIALTEARRQLPSLLKRLRADPKERIEITVRDEPVAELRAVVREPKPGEAARRLIALRRKLAKVKGRGLKDVSSRAEDHLYGPGGVLS